MPLFHEHYSPEPWLLEELKPAPGLPRHVGAQHPLAICILKRSEQTSARHVSKGAFADSNPRRVICLSGWFLGLK